MRDSVIRETAFRLASPRGAGRRMKICRNVTFIPATIIVTVNRQMTCSCDFGRNIYDSLNNFCFCTIRLFSFLSFLAGLSFGRCTRLLDSNRAAFQSRTPIGARLFSHFVICTSVVQYSVVSTDSVDRSWRTRNEKAPNTHTANF